jgi:hypothetical protein
MRKLLLAVLVALAAGCGGDGGSDPGGGNKIFRPKLSSLRPSSTR